MDKFNLNIDNSSQKKIRKVKKDRIVLDDDTFSPIIDELVFADIELQSYYNGLNDKTKKKIATIPPKEQPGLVRKLFNLKKNK